MRIAVGQVNPTVGDLEGNVRLIRAAAEEAARLDPDLIIFPEMALPGCHPKDILLDPGFVRAAQDALTDIAVQTAGTPPVILGTILPAGEPGPNHPNLYNAAVLLKDGTARIAAAKRSLPNHDIYSEPRWFIPGPPPKPIEINGTRYMVIVGEELDENPAPDAEVVISLNTRPFTQEMAWRGKPSTGIGRPLVSANLVGGNDDLIFGGGSFAINAEEELIAQMDFFTEQVGLIDLDGAPIPPPEPDEQNQIFQALTLGIRDFANKNRIEQAFLGLSGGIDSAVTVVLAAEALGTDRVTAVAMPSRYTDPRSTSSAQKLAENLGIKIEIVELEKMHTATEQELSAVLDKGLGAENLQARLRMIVLMAFVNRHGGMLLNTGNKTEAALGYATLYGDTAGSLCPIGDLTKPQVYQLAEWINREKEIIPRFCIERPPSAELRPGQIDPFDYDQVSPQVEALVQANQSSPVMRAGEHKRAQMGVVLKVSEKAFGPGRMIPITRK